MGPNCPPLVTLVPLVKSSYFYKTSRSTEFYPVLFPGLVQSEAHRRTTADPCGPGRLLFIPVVLDPRPLLPWTNLYKLRRKNFFTDPVAENWSLFLAACEKTFCYFLPQIRPGSTLDSDFPVLHRYISRLPTASTNPFKRLLKITKYEADLVHFDYRFRGRVRR
jgi:hypothetical protein